MSRHLPGIRARSCHVASRHLPRSRRNMTLTFARILATYSREANGPGLTYRRDRRGAAIVDIVCEHQRGDPSWLSGRVSLAAGGN